MSRPNESYPPENRLIGNFIAAGACGFAFDVVGEPNKVIKVCRLVDYEYLNPPTISDFNAQQNVAYGKTPWVGGIALNEFQAILFSQLYDMQKKGEEITPHLPKVYAFSSGEMQQSMMDEIRRSYEFYNWSTSKFRTIENNFHARRKVIPDDFKVATKPGTRIGLWIMERVVRAGGYDKEKGDVAKGKKQVVALNKWLRKHNYVVRDTENAGNWGFRKGTDEVVWFDPGVSPWPIKDEWRIDENVQLRNLYYLFKAGYGDRLEEYRRKLKSPQDYDNEWHQAEDNE